MDTQGARLPVGEDAVSEETMKCPAGGYFSLPAPIGGLFAEEK